MDPIFKQLMSTASLLIFVTYNLDFSELGLVFIYSSLAQRKPVFLFCAWRGNEMQMAAKDLNKF